MAAGSQEIFVHKMNRFPLKKLIEVLGIWKLPASSQNFEICERSQSFNSEPEPIWTGLYGSLDSSSLEKIFDSLNTDFSLLVIETYTFLINIDNKYEFNYTMYDENPYELFLTYLREIAQFLPFTFDSLNSLSHIWKKFEYPRKSVIWTDIFEFGYLLCLDVAEKVPFESLSKWRYYYPNLRIVSMNPIDEHKISKLTNFNSIDSIFRILTEYHKFRDTKVRKDTKRYFNVDSGSLANQSTWSKQHFDSKLLLTSSDPIKYEIMRALSGSFGKIQQQITPKRKPIPGSLRDALWRREIGTELDGNCFCCNTNVKYGMYEAGHVIAVALGGTNDIDNLRVVCSLCNKNMGIRNLYEFSAEFFPKIFATRIVSKNT